MDEQQIKDLIASTVTDKVTEALKSALSGDLLTNALKPLATAIKDDLQAEFEDLLTKPDPTPAADPAKADPAKPGEELSPEVRAKLRKLEKDFEAEKKAREAEQKAREDEELRNSIYAAMSAKSVKQQDAALKLFRDEGQFKRDNGKWFAVNGEEVKSLDDAVADFLATPTGGLFVAPSGTQGVGSTETKGAAATTTTRAKPSDAEFAAAFGF